MKNAYPSLPLENLISAEESRLQAEIEMTNTAGPSEWTIQKILGYSKSLEVNKSSMIGWIDQQMN